jgi:peptidyl-prolyl cis-trans isomerase C
MRPWLAFLVAGCLTATASAQAPVAAAPPRTAERVPAPVVNAKSVAVTVNGEPVYEGALARALRRVPPDRHAEARTSIMNMIIDNILIEQYLAQGGVKVETAEVDKKIDEMKAEIKKEKMDYAKVLQEMEMTEPELRKELTAFLRWEKYSDAQANDKVLRELFTSQKDMFDGSMVRVRHILLTPDSRDPKKVAEARQTLTTVRANINAQVTAGLAKLKPGTDALAREKARMKLIEDAFAAEAKAKSACPSKQQGGDVGWFDRAGTMVEQFSKVAFALKPFEMSDIVETQFGLHLILLLDRRPGKDVKIEDASVKQGVKEVYVDRLRDRMVQALRQRAKIVITPTPGSN